MKNNIGLSSASFYPDIKTEDAIKVMKKLGFNTGELFLNSPYEFTEEFSKILEYEKYENNFNINSVHAFSSFFEPYLFDSYDRRRNDMIKYFKDICKLAKTVGAKYYTFHGMRLQNIYDLNIKFILDIYNELAYIALSQGIKLAQENVSWCMSSSLDFLEILKEKSKYPVYFTFDIKQSYKANIDMNKYLNVMGDKLINFHVNDRDEENTCLLPGKGNVDYKGLYKKLKELNYKDTYIMEVYRNNYNSFNELIKSKEFLTKVFS